MLNNLNVLYIITQADGGGAQKYVLTLAKHFGGEIAAGEGNELFNQADQKRIPSYKLKHLKRNINPWHDLLACFEMYKLIKKVNPDIVHLNSSKAGLIGSIAGKLAGKKLIFTAHGFFFFDNTPLYIKWPYIFLEKFASLFRDFIITVSNHDRNNALNYKIIALNKIKTIHNGLPQINFFPRSEARDNLGLKDGFVIGNIAQYYYRKGLDILINAINLLPQEIKPKIKVLLIGEGPERKNLTDQIERLKLTDTIKLMGNIPNASQYLKALDLFILSSRVEGLPFALLEATQAQLPIIATNVGGNNEILEDAGIIIPSENPNALSNEIVKIINNSDLLQKLQAASSNRSRFFLDSQMLEETSKVYKTYLI